MTARKLSEDQRVDKVLVELHRTVKVAVAKALDDLRAIRTADRTT